LKIVRQAKEQGKSVVFFRVEGGNNRQRIQIKNVVRDAVGTTDGAFDVSPGQTNGFWAPSHVWPIDDPGKGRKEFGVLVPTKAPVWKLRVGLWVDTPISIQRLKNNITTWALLRSAGRPFFRAIRETWVAFYVADEPVIESELMTNSVPHA
jgi:hypothetical protein